LHLQAPLSLNAFAGRTLAVDPAQPMAAAQPNRPTPAQPFAAVQPNRPTPAQPMAAVQPDPPAPAPTEPAAQPDYPTPVSISLPVPAASARRFASPKLRVAAYVALAAACCLLAIGLVTRGDPQASNPTAALGALDKATPVVQPTAAAKTAPAALAKTAQPAAQQPAAQQPAAQQPAAQQPAAQQPAAQQPAAPQPVAQQPVAPQPAAEQPAAQPAPAPAPPAAAPPQAEPEAADEPEPQPMAASDDDQADAEADDPADKELAPNPELVRAQRLVDAGMSLTKQGRLGLAEASYLKALHLLPNYPRALAGLVRVHIARKDGAEAVRWAKRLVARKPNRALPQLLLGDAQALRGDAKAARAAWKNAARYGSAPARLRLRRS
jgi:hypothetical protein